MTQQTQELPTIKLSYLAKYGTTITDQTMLDLLNNAKWDCYTIVRYESLGKGKYYNSAFPATCTFYSDNRLYFFMTTDDLKIKDFFELNTFIDAKGELSYYKVTFN
jgi:hypothetical protein